MKTPQPDALKKTSLSQKITEHLIENNCVDESFLETRHKTNELVSKLTGIIMRDRKFFEKNPSHYALFIERLGIPEEVIENVRLVTVLMKAKASEVLNIGEFEIPTDSFISALDESIHLSENHFRYKYTLLKRKVLRNKTFLNTPEIQESLAQKLGTTPDILGQVSWLKVMLKCKHNKPVTINGVGDVDGGTFLLKAWESVIEGLEKTGDIQRVKDTARRITEAFEDIGSADFTQNLQISHAYLQNNLQIISSEFTEATLKEIAEYAAFLPGEAFLDKSQWESIQANWKNFCTHINKAGRTRSEYTRPKKILKTLVDALDGVAIHSNYSEINGEIEEFSNACQQIIEIQKPSILTLAETCIEQLEEIQKDITPETFTAKLLNFGDFQSLKDLVEASTYKDSWETVTQGLSEDAKKTLTETFQKLFDTTKNFFDNKNLSVVYNHICSIIDLNLALIQHSKKFLSECNFSFPAGQATYLPRMMDLKENTPENLKKNLQTLEKNLKILGHFQETIADIIRKFARFSDLYVDCFNDISDHLDCENLFDFDRSNFSDAIRTTITYLFQNSAQVQMTSDIIENGILKDHNEETLAECANFYSESTEDLVKILKETTNPKNDTDAEEHDYIDYHMFILLRMISETSNIKVEGLDQKMQFALQRLTKKIRNLCALDQEKNATNYQYAIKVGEFTKPIQEMFKKYDEKGEAPPIQALFSALLILYINIPTINDFIKDTIRNTVATAIKKVGSISINTPSKAPTQKTKTPIINDDDDISSELQEAWDSLGEDPSDESENDDQRRSTLPPRYVLGDLNIETNELLENKKYRKLDKILDEIITFEDFLHGKFFIDIESMISIIQENPTKYVTIKGDNIDLPEEDDFIPSVYSWFLRSFRSSPQCANLRTHQEMKESGEWDVFLLIEPPEVPNIQVEVETVNNDEPQRIDFTRDTIMDLCFDEEQLFCFEPRINSENEFDIASGGYKSVYMLKIAPTLPNGEGIESVKIKLLRKGVITVTEFNPGETLTLQVPNSPSTIPEFSLEQHYNYHVSHPRIAQIFGRLIQNPAHSIHEFFLDRDVNHIPDEERFDYAVLTEYIPGKTLRTMFSTQMNKSQERVEKIDGKTAQKIIDKPFFPKEIINSTTAQIVGLIDYLHKKGHTHLDLKPQNLMLHIVGTEARFCILDFTGFNPINNKFLSNADSIYGTPEYIDPYEWAGRAKEKNHYMPEVDYYALGVILYELITGNPFVDDYYQFLGKAKPNIKKSIDKAVKKKSKNAPEMNSEVFRYMHTHPIDHELRGVIQCNYLKNHPVLKAIPLLLNPTDIFKRREGYKMLFDAYESKIIEITKPKKTTSKTLVQTENQTIMLNKHFANQPASTTSPSILEDDPFAFFKKKKEK